MESQVIDRILEVRVVGKPEELGTLSPIPDRVCWQVNSTVVHWVLYPSGKVIEPWVIAPDVMYSTGYVRRPLLIK